MKAVTYFFFPLIFGILCQGSCSKWTPEDGIYTSEEHATQLSETTENIAADGLNMVVNADIWIDKMPKIGGEPNKLNGVVTLEDMAGRVLPDDASIHRLYLVNQNEIWVVTPKLSDDNPANSRSVHFGNGPNWTENTTIQLVCQFSMGGETFKVRNSALTVHAVH